MGSNLKNYPNIFVAGQLSGVEGYVESISSGLYSAINMAKMLSGQNFVEFSTKTAIGSLPAYISNANPNNFQPMNSNWGIMEKCAEEKLDRAKIALEEIREIMKNE